MTEAARLRPLLSSEWQPAIEVQREAEAEGLSPDQVRAARKALGVTRDTGGVARRDGRWWWRLPDGCPTCGRSWREPWAMEGQGGDYYAQSRPSLPANDDDDPAAPLDNGPSITRLHCRNGPPRLRRCSASLHPLRPSFGHERR